MKDLKHVKLFEQFSQEGGMDTNPLDDGEGKVVIGVVSEGCDAGIFEGVQAEKLWNYLSSIKSDYYFPFRLKLPAQDHPQNKLYLLVNSNNVVELLPSQPRTMAGVVEVAIVSHYDLTLLQGNLTPISIFNADGTEESDEPSNSTYALELVGDNKYMSVQSWGQSLQSDAFKHFMEFQDDEA
jgi:hypothetical protein